MKCFEIVYLHNSYMNNLPLTVNMKCFEINIVSYFFKALTRLTVNMKCFEMGKSKTLKSYHLINRKHEMF